MVAVSKVSIKSPYLLGPDGLRRIVLDSILTLVHHIYNLYLFTASDFKTILFPEAFFAICTSLSLFGYAIDVPQVCSRIPLAMVWIYSNLLPFNINN